MSALRFQILARSSSNRARLGRVTTPHGSFDTPAFMPVATAAAMKGLTPAQVRGTGSQIILNNAYHLFLRPGGDRLERFGGSHRFMRWDGPILTDSGGYQAYSMSDTAVLGEDGVTFRSFIDGSKVHLGPESSMRVQNQIGADIIMAFDDCAPAALPEEGADERRLARTRRIDDHARRLEEAHERTLRWLDRCVRAHARPQDQALFGIVQGATDLDLRRRSVEGVCSHDLPGFAIGGVAVGEGTDAIRKVVEFTAPLLPEAKPRYLMGVGYERDIVMAVAAGVDMFDCVLPTRNGRNANAFTRNGSIRLRNARFADDHAPIDPSCDCEACAGGFSRAYLRHLFTAEEMLGPTLVSVHNIRHFQRLMMDIRTAIREDAWSWLLGSWPCI
ncbi:MAG: tRNA guanosine(34) transglycosylase Tgt, partial [Proteobacteria bacterium]|nr:tRNA guanosine(34) transglycosylase Tgt [Pseudomonadota bacterium]